MIPELNEQNFAQEIIDARPVLVDFWAAWCGPCRAQAPILDKLDPNKVKVCKVNVDVNPNLCIKYAISSIPTMVLFKDGERKQKLIGLHTLEQLEDYIAKL